MTSGSYEKSMSSHVQMLTFLLNILSILLSVQNVFAFDPKTLCNNVEGQVWNYIPCDEYYQPDNCSNKSLTTLDDFDLCGPSYIPLIPRNFYLSATGRRETYIDNKIAIRKIKIIPKALRPVSKYSTKVKVLGTEIDFPIGIDPVALLKLAHPDGELALASGLSSFNPVMILSSAATSSIEDVAKTAKGTSLNLWMQTYFFKNQSLMADIVHRAEKNGFKAIVATVDSNIHGTVSCDAYDELTLPPGVKVVNIGPDFRNAFTDKATFDDLKHLKCLTKLPIVAKGILSGADAIKAIKAGVSAILVSNHGGRQMGYAPATIDALPGVVDAVRKRYPHIEIYMDGGIRGGYDVYKALARGAKMVFMGRPAVWGIAYNGSHGAHQVMDIVRKEFQEVMRLSGHTHPSQIKRGSLLPQTHFCEEIRRQ